MTQASDFSSHDPSEMIPLAKARKLFPANTAGKRPALATLKRWHAKGLKGVKLPAWRIGGRWYTSEAACRDFIVKLNCVTGNQSLIPKRSARDLARIKRRLVIEGFYGVDAKRKALGLKPIRKRK